MAKLFNNIHALLFSLSEDLAGELLAPLKGVLNVKSVQHTDQVSAVVTSPADIIFCGNNVETVYRTSKRQTGSTIVVVSRHPEVGDWLDSIEAGATDYCAAPFEKSQLQWILETSMKATPAMA